MIYEIDNPLLLPKILELAKLMPDVPLDKLRDMLADGITRIDTKIFVDEKDGAVRGFIFASVEIFEGEDAVYVQICTVDPFSEDETQDGQNIFDNLLGRIISWAQELGVSNIYMGTKRHKAFKRRAKFEYSHTIMKRSVKHGQPVQV